MVQDPTQKHDSACVRTCLDYTAMGVDVVWDSTLKHDSACVSICLIYCSYSHGCGCDPRFHWDTRLCMCKYLSYLLIIQLWVWMWPKIPLGYATLHVLVPVLFIYYTAMGVDVVPDSTGIHDSACVSTCFIY